MANKAENLLLEALRSHQEVPPSQGDELVKALKDLSNKLDDIKQATAVTSAVTSTIAAVLQFYRCIGDAQQQP